jgi:hypothetical protein
MGCSDQQCSYRYPGCPEPASDQYRCLQHIYCALGQIRQRYGDPAHTSCSAAADCVAVQTPIEAGRCHVGICPPIALNVASRASLEAEMNAEINRFCSVDGGGCSSSGSCLASGPLGCWSGRCGYADGGISTVGAGCADRDAGVCWWACASDEICLTQVACGALQDGGVACSPTSASGGDDRCHKSCEAGPQYCPPGEICRQVAAFACHDYSGAPGGHWVCCAADGGCA